MKIDLSGSRALVCGASKGIGRAIAEAFADCGARVTVVSRRREELESVVASLKGSGHSAMTLDLSRTSEIEEPVNAALKEGAYDILVCNAGGPPGGAISAATAEDILKAMTTHLIANQKLVQLLLPGMEARHSGRIFTITSTSVKIPIPHLGVSNTVRAAVASWVKTLSYELGPMGITVNNLLPGYTSTDRLSELMTNQAQKTSRSHDDIEAEWLKTIPLQRFGKPHELAALCAFLASPLGAYITGTNIPVDGGRTGCL